MLKVLSSSCVKGRFRSAAATSFSPANRHEAELSSPLLRVLRSFKDSRGRSPNLIRRAFFCSDSGDGSGQVVEAEVKAVEGEAEEVDSKVSSAIVPTNPRPEDYLTVLALPLPHRPLFPGFYMPIYVKDPKLLAALAESRKRQAPYAGAFLLKDEPGTDSTLTPGSDTEKNIYDLKGKDLLKRLHEVGTLAQITSIQGDQVVLIGHRRLRITDMVSEDPLTVKVDHLKDEPFDKDDDVIKATSFEVISTLRDVLKTSSLWRDHVQTYTQHIGDFNYPRLADFGAAISGANKLQCQEVLEELDVHKRLKLTLELVKKEMEISKIQESIAKAIEEKISGEQRRYLLNEQLKAIKKELGLEADDKTALSAKFRERLDPNKEKIPAHVLQVIEEELTKLQLLEASSSEFNVTRNYLDWLTALPWGNYSDENFDVIRAQKILDEDHYGLTDVKERILEFIAVGKLRGTSQGKIICLSGPPGVGKTSIGRSIAHALNRKFYRFSVGGLADVAEIKGHRRTYIGAMPGKMVQCLKNVGTSNPLVLIDEIDKLGRGHAGDPASAMLELLDPEQNANFLDHYLDVSIDLSKVLFVCTANVVEMIPNPLLDRMEIISIAGYISDEKMHIARDYLEKSTREACGIKPEQVEVTDPALLALIENYCREAGVRSLQKHIEKIYRKIALQLVRQGVSAEPPLAEPNKAVAASASGSIETETEAEVVEQSSHEKAQESSPEANTAQTHTSADEVQNLPDQTIESKDMVESKEVQESDATKTVEKVLIDSSNLSDFVGKPVFHAERIYDQTPVGVVMGLAWTAMGGSTLYIETTQIEFDCVLHKLYGEEWRRQLDEYSRRNPDSCVIDPPEAIERLHNRISMLQVVSELRIEDESETFGIPKQIVIYDSETLFDRQAWEGLKFPVIAKPLVADGSAKSHKMALIFNHDGLNKLKPPIVLQEFVNHGGVIFKVYVVGEHVQCVKRKSLPDVSEEKLGSLEGSLSFSQVSNLTANERSDGNCYETTHMEEIEMPPNSFITEIARGLRQAMKLNLFNFDVIRDARHGNRYLVIDINYFPGYAKMPSYESVLTDFFTHQKEKGARKGVDTGDSSETSYDMAQVRSCDKEVKKFIVCSDGDDGALPVSPPSREEKESQIQV